MKTKITSERGLIIFLSALVLALYFFYGYSAPKMIFALSEEEIDEYLKPSRVDDLIFPSGGAITFHEEYADNSKALLAFKHRHGKIYRELFRLAGMRIDAPIYTNMEDYWIIDSAYACAYAETGWRKTLTKEEREVARSFIVTYFRKYHNEEIRNCDSLRILKGMVRDEDKAKLILPAEFEAYLERKK